MMNYIWAGMLCVGIAFAGVNGRLDSFADGLMSSCAEGVQFVIGLSGIMAVWSGLMRIAEKSGLMEIVSMAVMPLMKYLFPHVKNKETIAMMLMSFTTNIFGAGNSATVFSLKAMELLDEENSFKPMASNEMCMFTALNMSMLQLVPITILKIRSDLGSVDPGSIIIPSIIAGLASMIVSIAICKLYERKIRHVFCP